MFAVSHFCSSNREWGGVTWRKLLRMCRSADVLEIIFFIVNYIYLFEYLMDIYLNAKNYWNGK